VKVFFQPLLDFDTVTVDAWVPSVDQGVAVLSALAAANPGVDVIMRARLKTRHDFEERYIGLTQEAGPFIERVKEMGR
jgi:hypothetical protein